MTSIKGIFEKGTDVLKVVIEFLWVLAFVVFILGVVKFIAAAGNPEKRKSAKDLIIYGLVGIFVLLSFMGLIQIAQSTIFGGPSSGSNYDSGYDVYQQVPTSDSGSGDYIPGAPF